VYYTNAVNTLIDLNLWTPSDDLAADYVSFKHLHEELVSLFAANCQKKFSLYDVEHVFWFKGGNPYEATQTIPKDAVDIRVVSKTDPIPIVLVPNPLDRLPDSYVPPVISILPRLACNAPGLEDLAYASGISVARAFEKNINIAFTMLGYETKLLGQGGGRVPDGIATDHDNSYAIIWDAKVRGGSYSMGTDDRAIREYIVTQSREMKRRRSLRNVYYALISNRFSNDFDEEIRSIKMETEISEVCLIEAKALVAIVEAKLRDPIHLTLGPDGIQRLFSSSGIISVDTVTQNLTG
jgi:Restriction endonuclease FokI, C terminal